MPKRLHHSRCSDGTNKGHVQLTAQGIFVSVWNIRLTERFDATLNSTWSRVNDQIQTPLTKTTPELSPVVVKATQRGDRKYPLSRRGCCCVWGSLGVKWKRQWVEPQRGKEERKEREKSERAARGERQEGRGERKKGGKEGRKRERDRWKLETYALDCPLSVSGPLNGLLKSKLWNNSTLYSSANTWVDSL